MATRARRTTAQNDTDDNRQVPQATTTAVNGKFPAAWGDMAGVESFGGHNPTDKADLIGVPFLVIGAEFEKNENRDYDVAWIYALDVNGTEFEFSDASTGVRETIRDEFEKREKPATPETGYLAFRMLAPRGLRVSEFTAVDQATGKKRAAQTYYFAGSGRTNV